MRDDESYRPTDWDNWTWVPWQPTVTPSTVTVLLAHQEFRCPSCRRLLFCGVLDQARVEIKCPKCQTTTEFPR